jgi:hypothetical protein
MSTESISVVVHGETFTGTLHTEDVGRGKVSFAVMFQGRTKRGTSIVRAASSSPRALAETDLRELVKEWKQGR